MLRGTSAKKTESSGYKGSALGIGQIIPDIVKKTIGGPFLTPCRNFTVSFEFNE